MADWQPAQYLRFAAERRQPFDVLLTLLRPVAGGRIVDLGCGTGELTRELHEKLEAGETVGVDSSPAMLDEARAMSGDGVRFELGDLGTFDGAGGTWDLIVASASLQWVPDHAAVIGRWVTALAPGGQVAVQVPANGDHASHEVMREVAAERGVAIPRDVHGTVLPPERYAEVLDGLGLVDVHVRLQVFLHHLQSAADVIEWVKGTALRRVRDVTTEDEYADFLVRYSEVLLDRLGHQSPYLYAFKRILMMGSAPA
jgi:trans-aconitate 2-methyltransferase